MDTALRDRACITGVGQTDYSKQSGRSVQVLALQAARAAIADAGLKPNEIDAILPYVLGSRPTLPGRKEIGTNTAISTSMVEITAKPISAPLRM